MPLQLSASIGLIGKWASYSDDIFDLWVANAKLAEYRPATLLEGMQAAGVSLRYADGYYADRSTSERMINEAIAAAGA